MKKGSVFASKKGPLSTGYGTPVNISSTSSSFFDNSLQQIPHNQLGGPPRNWQATPLNSHRFPFLHYQLQQQQQQPNSASSIRAHPMVASALISNTPNSSMINRVKPYTLQGLVENLNEVKKKFFFIHHYLSFFSFIKLLAELAIAHSMRYDTKYGFEDILTVLDVCISDFS